MESEQLSLSYLEQASCLEQWNGALLNALVTGLANLNSEIKIKIIGFLDNPFNSLMLNV